MVSDVTTHARRLLRRQTPLNAVTDARRSPSRLSPPPASEPGRPAHTEKIPIRDLLVTIVYDGTKRTFTKTQSNPQPFLDRVRPSLAPFLALTTRRNFNRINHGSKVSVSIVAMISASVIFSPSLLRRQVGSLRLGLHKRRCRSGFQCAPHNLPPNRIIKQRIDLIRCRSASLTFLVSVSLLSRR